MNVETETETAQFPENEYINGIFLAVYGAEVSVAKPVSASRTVPEYVEERHDPTLHSSRGWQRLEHFSLTFYQVSTLSA
jgi:hypothetical protein